MDNNFDMASIDDIKLLLETNNKFARTFGTQVLTESSKIKILNILIHIFNILPNDVNLSYRIHGSDYMIVKTKQKEISDDNEMLSSLLAVEEIDNYNINIDDMCNSIISSNNDEIEELISIFI